MPADALPQLPEHNSTRPPTFPARLRRKRTAGMELVAIESPAVSEFHLTVTPRSGEPHAFLVKRLADALNAGNATVVRMIVFGSVNAFPATVAALRQSLDDPNLPATWVEGAACSENPLAGIQVHAVAGTEVQTLQQDGLPQVRVWQDAAFRHCVMGAFGPGRIVGTRSEQARASLAKLQAGFAQAGLGMKDVARTWLFLDDILSWYGDFNQVRNQFFEQNELRPGRFPASTGVSGRNPGGAAMAGAAWAVRSLDPGIDAVRIVGSPRQCGAPSYGSAFSRAVEIKSAGCRQLLVSGTASIEPGGKTAHIGDVRAQIELTMQVIENILTSRRMTFAEVSRATAYFRFAKDAPLFADWLERRELRSLPVVNACCDICRDDLLFELELDAIQPES